MDFRFDGERYRKRSPQNTRAGAQEYEAFLRQKLARGETELVAQRQGDTPETFAEAAQRWLNTYVRANVKDATERWYASVVRLYLIPAFGRHRLESLSSLEIDTFKAALQNRGLHPSTINSVLIALRCMLNRGHEWGWMKSVPKIRNVKVPPRRFDFLSAEEGATLLSANRGMPYHDMILTALRTGMRRGELLGLRWEDVDLERRMIVVRRAIVYGKETSTKSNRERHVPIANDLLATLSAKERVGLLVLGNEASDGPHRALRGLHAACDRAGLRRVGWHVLRHSFASQLASRGAPIPAVQALLGHASIRMTMRYSHMSPSTLRDTIALLGTPATRQSHESGQPAVKLAC